MSERLILTVPEAASKLGLSRNAAYEAARRGDIPTVRIGKRVLVPIAALEHLLETGRQQSQASPLPTRSTRP